ncbi:hypothetical protein SAMN04515674_106153 [Pseudarcicella hirudinis]|uniref:Uncharacterized protein n=1 Tax=Pseudarcicella hirudinis TaxID=1079859 RepID=A0A1I5TQE1_9BACT|nr:hypothetical protein SAMN04515674_106153 [Pseudarcicella hirudinis]
MENLTYSELVEITGGSSTTYSWGKAVGEFIKGFLDAF